MTQREQTAVEHRIGIGNLDYPVPIHGKSIFYTLGGAAFVGFLILFSTGLLMAQFFNPVPGQAHDSVYALMVEVPGGRYLRSLHYWTAQAVIGLLLLHLIRVFLTGAYKPPRRLTWLVGVGLLATTLLGSYFSGTVIKADQEGADALHHYKESLEYLGPIGDLLLGKSPTGAPLEIRMYLSHVSLFPLLLAGLMVLHFYLIRMFNLSPLPFGPSAAEREVPQERMTSTFLEHVKSILFFSLIYYGLIATAAFLFPAPLGDPPGEMTGIKPPWPFLWIYGLENFWGIKAILIGNGFLFGLLLLVPFLGRGSSRHWMDRKKMLLSGGVVGLALIGLTFYAWISPSQVHEGHSHSDEETDHAPGTSDHPHSEGENDHHD